MISASLVLFGGFALLVLIILLIFFLSRRPPRRPAPSDHGSTAPLGTSYPASPAEDEPVTSADNPAEDEPLTRPAERGDGAGVGDAPVGSALDEVVAEEAASSNGAASPAGLGSPAGEAPEASDAAAEGEPPADGDATDPDAEVLIEANALTPLLLDERVRTARRHLWANRWLLGADACAQQREAIDEAQLMAATCLSQPGYPAAGLNRYATALEEADAALRNLYLARLRAAWSAVGAQAPDRAAPDAAGAEKSSSALIDSGAFVSADPAGGLHRLAEEVEQSLEAARLDLARITALAGSRVGGHLRALLLQARRGVSQAREVLPTQNPADTGEAGSSLASSAADGARAGGPGTGGSGTGGSGTGVPGANSQPGGLALIERAEAELLRAVWIRRLIALTGEHYRDAQWRLAPPDEQFWKRLALRAALISELYLDLCVWDRSRPQAASDLHAKAATALSPVTLRLAAHRRSGEVLRADAGQDIVARCEAMWEELGPVLVGENETPAALEGESPAESTPAEDR